LSKLKLLSRKKFSLDKKIHVVINNNTRTAHTHIVAWWRYMYTVFSQGACPSTA